eukprot:CAMPEP_0201590892 /NCGR_PEP_ID=MMETSP0190_2-20130828/183023_1 /ASSEMBLY_ACC=CAM_ASM_000263 /TAXON_ID=37353 /ORGANISM="Rosalina sp." /LENGTH=78 /DNA_ID=CAMNT_0048047983 /DNA_START=104 /DNA_END=340 /DNA_ORIENTATION=-
MEMGTLHIPSSYGEARDGRVSYQVRLSANSPKDGLFGTHEAYDTIDIADQIAEDMRKNKQSPVPEPETDAEDSIGDLL